MATPTIVEALSDADSGAAASVATGGGTQVGDLLVAAFGNNYFDGASMAPPTGTAGTWVEEAYADAGTNTAHLRVYTREVTSGGAQTITVIPVSSEEVYLDVYVLRDWSAVDDATANASATQTTSPVAPSVDAVGTDDLLLCFWQTGAPHGGPTFTAAPGGMTNLRQVADPAGPFSRLASARQTLAASGATGTRTATISAASQYASASIVIAGTAGATPVAMADAGAAVAALSATAAAAVADAAATGETLATSAAAGLTDSAPAADALTAVAAAGLEDAGISADSCAVSSTVALADFGVVVDGVAVAAAVGLADSAAIADTCMVGSPVPVADSGAAADQMVIASAVPMGDTAAAADSCAAVVTVPLGDTGASAQALAAAAAVQQVDEAAAVEQLTATAAGSLADSAAAVESLAVTAGLNLLDTATGADQLAQGQPIALGDGGGSAEGLTVTSATTTLTDVATSVESVAAAVDAAFADVGAVFEAFVAEGPPPEVSAGLMSARIRPSAMAERRRRMGAGTAGADRASPGMAATARNGSGMGGP